MAIISAGVIMNIIFAFIFAVIAYGMGVPYSPAIVSETSPGSPAWQAGLEPGDEIVKIGDRSDPTFKQLMEGVVLGDAKNGIPFQILRAENGEVIDVPFKPEQQSGKLAMIGMSGPQSLVLHDEQPTIENSPAASARLIAPTAPDLKNGPPKLQKGDKIVQVGDKRVTTYREFAAVLAAQPDKPLEITVERPLTSAEKDTDATSQVDSATLKFEVPPHVLRNFGLVMKIGPITAVQANSPAAAAGVKSGDVIESVDGKQSDEAGGWTPESLPELMRQAAAENREVQLIVMRSSKGEATPERVTVKVAPRTPTMFNSFNSGVPLGLPQGVEALGIAFHVTNEVAGIVDGGPAEKTGIQPGDKIIAAKIVFPDDKDGKPVKPKIIELGHDQASWTHLLERMQFAPPKTTVTLTVVGAGNGEPRDVTIKPSPTAGVFDASRGFAFEPITRTRTAGSFADQVRYGWEETWEALTMVVRFLQKLGTQVPLTMLGGPGTIAAAAGMEASKGLPSLLIFLTMLSANLAVINFLPIPLLDGGHMTFLAYEGLRGRPANERVVIALHTAGFVFIISLMLFVIGLDIQRWLFT
jgi:regulator of sigma E protease